MSGDYIFMSLHLVMPNVVGLLGKGLKEMLSLCTPTWQCTRKIEDALVELTDSSPVVKEHFHHLSSSNWLRQWVFIGKIDVPRGGWWCRAFV